LDVPFFKYLGFLLPVVTPVLHAWYFIHLLLMSNFLAFFTFMLPSIVIDFFLNNQPDALIIQILFCYKTLHVSGILCPSSGILYCTFGTVKFRAATFISE